VVETRQDAFSPGGAHSVDRLSLSGWQSERHGDMKLFVGTSGFSHKEWRGSFYPEKLKPDQMLGYYAERLNAVEITNTFYRMPSKRLLAGWSEQVPEGFSFVVQVPRRITHQKRLRNAATELAYLLDTVSALGRKLGPVLFQLPPFLRRDLPGFVDFLDLLPDGSRAVFEFRHPSWFEKPVLEELRLRNLAVVVADTGSEIDPPRLATADYGYLRLRRPEYGKADLKEWAAWAAQQAWSEVYAFFKPEDQGSGPRLAGEFRDSLHNVMERRKP
jgi:uncharacterized protein YecE (DUF72 family)